MPQVELKLGEYKILGMEDQLFFCIEKQKDGRERERDEEKRERERQRN